MQRAVAPSGCPVLLRPVPHPYRLRFGDRVGILREVSDHALTVILVIGANPWFVPPPTKSLVTFYALPRLTPVTAILGSLS
jgi:hypothetical protein